MEEIKIVLEGEGNSLIQRIKDARVLFRAGWAALCGRRVVLCFPNTVKADTDQ